MKWIVWRHAFIAKWLPLSGSTRLVMRKRKGGAPVGLYKQRKRRTQSDMLATLSYVRRIHSSMVDILSCSFVRHTLYREIFFLRRPAHRDCKMKKFEIRFCIDLITLWSISSRAFMNHILPSLQVYQVTKLLQGSLGALNTRLHTYIATKFHRGRISYASCKVKRKYLNRCNIPE